MSRKDERSNSERGGTMKGCRNDMPRVVLRSTLGYLEREAARRAKGQHAGMLRLHDGELAALLDVVRREVGGSETEASR